VGRKGGRLLLAVVAPLTASIAGAASPAEATSQTLPPPGIYKIDPDHSFVSFGALHHVVGLVRGRFDKVTGTITVSPDPAACAVDITIAAYSLSTQNTERDDDLRGPDFFDVDKFPQIRYHGRGIRRASSSSWALDGSLTIRGVTKVVRLTFTFNGLFPDTKPGKPQRAAFHGSASTKRADFGMTRDNLMELGSSPPAADVQIEIDLEADSNNPTPR